MGFILRKSNISKCGFRPIPTTNDVIRFLITQKHQIPGEPINGISRCTRRAGHVRNGMKNLKNQGHGIYQIHRFGVITHE